MYHSQVTALLLYKGATVDKRDRFGKTALHHACKRGDASAVEVLLCCGADVTAEDASGKDPMQLTLAAKNRQNKALCVELISLKISEISRNENFAENREKYFSIFSDAVSRAAESGDMEILKALTRNFQVPKGAVKREKSEKTVPPLISAVVSKKPETIKVRRKFQVLPISRPF